MKMPFGFGVGSIGRVMLRWPAKELEDFLSIRAEDEPNKCAYNLMHLEVQQRWARAIKIHREKE